MVNILNPATRLIDNNVIFFMTGQKSKTKAHFTTADKICYEDKITQGNTVKVTYPEGCRETSQPHKKELLVYKVINMVHIVLLCYMMVTIFTIWNIDFRARRFF